MSSVFRATDSVDRANRAPAGVSWRDAGRARMEVSKTKSRGSVEDCTLDLNGQGTSIVIIYD
jgi:hypothetical protein